VAKTVKVHDDTHTALKQLKAQRRGRSIDEVIREMVRQTTGQPVERLTAKKGSELTAFLQ
jgi:predicted CopG family antitoxin